MNRLALASLSLTLGACAALAPKDTPTDTPADPFIVRGTAAAPSGSSLKIAVVDRFGSNSMRTGNGPFELPFHSSGSATLVATTDDGRIGWVENVTGGSEGHVVKADLEGGFLRVKMDGRNAVRIGVDHGDTRIQDNTVRTGTSATFVVPPGPIEVVAYCHDDGDVRVFERKTLTVAANQTLDWTVDASR